MTNEPLTHQVPHDELLELKDLLNHILTPIVQWDANELTVAKATVNLGIRCASAGLVLLNKYLTPGTEDNKGKDLGATL